MFIADYIVNMEKPGETFIYVITCKYGIPIFFFEACFEFLAIKTPKISIIQREQEKEVILNHIE